MEHHKRTHFGTKVGVVMAAAGSAVGLGNIWKFPYEVGQNGGAAFLLIYILCVLLLGMPVMLSEFLIGRRARANVAGAFRKLSGGNRWALMGLLGVVCAFFILSFYFVVAGWGIEYIYQAACNNFAGKTTDGLARFFADFSSSSFRPLLWDVVFILLTLYVVVAGVEKGIERYSKILMPFLLLILILLCVRSVTMDNASAGLAFLFKPDFSKITPTVILSALGQAFFSLSLGLGCMITYGSYIRSDNNLMRTVAQVSVLDTIVAVLSGVAIFPAVFALGINPAQGPQLVFVTLPSVFTQMPGGYIFAILFFVLLSIAALTSTISILEIMVAFVSEEFHCSRKNAAIVTSLVIVISSALCSLSLGADTRLTLFGRTLFDWCDFLVSKILMPVGGFFIAIFVGWFCSKKDVRDELSHGAVVSEWFVNAFLFLMRFVVPIAILLIFLNELGVFDLLS